MGGGRTKKTGEGGKIRKKRKNIRRGEGREIRGDGGEMVEDKNNGYDMELKIQRKKESRNKNALLGSSISL